MRGKQLQGLVFGRLKVIRSVGSTDRGAKLWLCECKCGNTTTLTTSLLTSGNTKSCGCLIKDLIVDRNTTHGKSKTRLYQIYCGMRQRCNYSKHKDYQRYGGRGISVCKEWDKFEEFEAWANNSGYAAHLSLDRIDCNGNYEPSNCRWSSNEVQARNKTNNHYLEFNGESKTIAEWSREVGISTGTIRYRLKKGLCINDVLKTKK